MFPRVTKPHRHPIKIWTDDVEESALNQLHTLSKLPFIHKHIAVMPDVHAGRGSTIGTVIATKGAIIPSAIGVDIGCGMSAVKLPFSIGTFDNIPILRALIESAVPVGFKKHVELSLYASNYMKRFGDLTYSHKDKEKILANASLQLGTLGGGNHFIEICKDELDNAWVMLHSGSRNIGKRIADYHISKAKGVMKDYFIDIPDPDLAYFVQGTQDFNDYVHDMNWAQRYAFANRNLMMDIILKKIAFLLYDNGWLENNKTKELIELKIDCHHNYAQMENHFGSNIFVTRKGAVSAKENELGIIPGSMGDKSFIVKGLGNKDSFCSCSHGAGRKMSRNKARELYNKEDLASQTLGVDCRKDEAVVDEIPSAYKRIDDVMDNQKDLVSIVHTLKQLICIKG